jgi:hypothetical protein
VQRGDQWAQTNRYTNRATGSTTRTTRTSGGGAAVTRNNPGVGNNSGVVRTGGGDVYAGHDGNVYKRGSDGSWQQQGGVARPTTGTAGTARSTTTDQLNRDYQARTEGAQRTRDYGSYQSSGGSRSSASSYRSSGGGGGYRGGGGSRGGGGRRR